MANYKLCIIMQRILWPLIVICSAAIRPAALSIIYLILLFIMPFVPIATTKNIKGCVGVYFIIWILISTLFLATHIGLQVALITMYDFIGECTSLEVLLRHVGFIKLTKLSVLAVVEWTLPEILTFLVSIIFFIVTKKVVRPRREEIVDEENKTENAEDDLKPSDSTLTRDESEEVVNKVLPIAPFAALLALFLAAVFRPSVPGGFYFVVFLCSGTYWACYKEMGRGFAIVLRLVMIVLVCHIVAIFIYQTPWPQENLEGSSLTARLTALEPLLISTCDNAADVRVIFFNYEVDADSYINPVVMIICYLILATSSKLLIKQKLMSRSTMRNNDVESVPAGDAIPMEDLEPKEQKGIVFLDYISYGWDSICEFIYKNSFIFTNVLMMVWSIIYHSWLTFVLLIWANILWMIPNQRKTMFRTSPFIVFYASLLLLAQYIFGLNLTDDELPFRVETKGVNLLQIGLTKERTYPCFPLFVKTSFTVMFWITLRQFSKEAKEKRRTTTLADMVAPLQITVGAATSDLTSKEKKSKKANLLSRFADAFQKSLIRIWIWLLLIVIFLCGISGTKMTGFRVCYMALFLFFILVFQLSWKAWIKIMYGFWLVLIVYAMSILIMVYTYQFDHFDNYWENYVGISKTLQLDLGLKKYKTKDLFFNLFNPTVIVIMTVLQVHYFHDGLIKNLQSLESPESKENLQTAGESTDAGEGPSTGVPPPGDKKLNDDKQDADVSGTGSETNFEKYISTLQYYATMLLELLMIFIEIHIYKIIFVWAFWCCMSQTCFLHIGFVLLTVAAVMCNERAQFYISRMISIIMSILILTKMMYQVEYISHRLFDVSCANSPQNEILNNAEWFGLTKIPVSANLFELLIAYIGYMTIVTIHAANVVRQVQNRTVNVEDKVMFPGVKRSDADEKFIDFVKYMFNYGYFKFGLEITLICLVALICYRQDIVAILYCFWLCILFSLKRSNSAKLWRVFQLFTAILIIIQYFIFVGLPPEVCLEYPWDQSAYKDAILLLAMVPGSHLKKQTMKLFIEFLLLFFISRQSVVFSIEKKYAELEEEYDGGSNKLIIDDIENAEANSTPLNNPVWDFISLPRHWMDIFQIAVTGSFFWITLAVVFLTGTSMISLFSVVYLFGSFLLLWQGSDFFLRPIRNILKWFYILLTYNVIVIVLKTCLQIAGCVFFNMFLVEYYACWFVHLFGVTCAWAPPRGDETENHEECIEVPVDSGLIWDAVCFAFLLFQLRLFHSYYFVHMVNDAKASTILASRGAEIIEDLREKEIAHRIQQEQKLLRKLKKKMEKIKAKQDELKAGTHFDALKRRPDPDRRMSHEKTILAGDYYLFDDLDEKLEVDIVDKQYDFLTSHGAVGDSERRMSRRRTLGQVQGRTRGGTEAEFKPDTETEPGTDKDDDQKEMNLAIVYIEACLVSLTNWLYKFSRNYRYVMKILQEEKKGLKETGFALSAYSRTDNVLNDLQNIQPPDNPSRKRGGADEPEDLDFSTTEHNIVIELLIALWYAVIANTDILCYIFGIINQIASASLISLPIPFLIFLWGTLSIPRPTKTFWITLIAYTQALVLIKSVFQFKMIWFNKGDTPSTPLSPARIIGIEQTESLAIYDLMLLLVLFIHRIILKNQGLWKSDYSDDIEAGVYVLKGDEGSDKPGSEDGGSLVLVSKNVGDTAGDDQIQVSTFVDQAGRYFPRIIAITGNKYFQPITTFFQDLIYKPRLSTDVYACMFFCDFTNFFVLLFGFSAFGGPQGEGGVQTYLEENKIPVAFLIMLLLQFILILMDRTLYLRRALRSRIGFHFFLTIGIHVWMFFVLPSVTERGFNSAALPIAFYFIKCLYLILSGYQIRCGYPSRILGNFITSQYAFANRFSFKLYMMVPFLYELRTFLDWVCTKTTLTLFSWLKMEEIYTEIYFIKCLREYEKSNPTPRGYLWPLWYKILMGGGLTLALIIIIWAPLTLFALSNAVGISNVPYQVSVSLKLGSYAPVYEMSVEESDIHQFSKQMYSDFEVVYAKNKKALSFLWGYDPVDIAAIELGKSSAALWNISPPDQERLIEDLIDDSPLACHFKYTISRKTHNAQKNPGVISAETTFDLPPASPERRVLLEMIEGKGKASVVLLDLIPKFLKIKNNGKMSAIPNFVSEETKHRDLVVRLESSGKGIWWNVQEDCNKDEDSLLEKLPRAGCLSKLVIYTFSDKLFPSSVTYFTAGGIIGMYTTFVIVCSRFIRSWIYGASRAIMFTDLPCVDRVLQLCLDIYLVRESLEFRLEEDLYAKLIFLYRSPETMIKWTRPLDDEDIADEQDSENKKKK